MKKSNILLSFCFCLIPALGLGQNNVKKTSKGFPFPKANMNISAKKSIEKPSYILDSVYKYNDLGDLVEKGYSYYDTNGLEISSTGYMWQNEQWMPNIKDSIVYDEQGNTSEYFLWMAEAPAYDYWQESQHEIKKYDTQNRLTEHVQKQFNPINGEWNYTQKIIYTYDGENRKPIEENYFDYWDQTAGIPVLYYNLKYRAFDSKGNPHYADGFVNKKSQEGPEIEPELEPLTWDTLVYDNAGNLTEQRQWSYNSYDSTITASSKQEYVYDDSNREISYIQYYVSFIDGSWEASSKEETVYAEEGYISQYNLFQLSYTSHDWVKVNSIDLFWSEYNKDPKLYDVGVVSINSPENNSQWNNAEEVSISIKNFGQSSVSNIPLSCLVNEIHLSATSEQTIKPGQVVNFSFPTTVDMSKLKTYHITAYTKLSEDTSRKNDTCRKTVQKLGIEESEKPTLSYYPNPTTELLFIQSTSPIKNIRVFNLSGQVVKEIKGMEHNNMSISLSEHKKGMYIIEIRTTQSIERRSVMHI